MTRDQAIRTAAAWWHQAIRSRKWDNGDRFTERAHAVFSSLVPPITDQDLEQLHGGLVDMIRQQLEEDEGRHRGPFCSEVYADYGCHQLDELYNRLGLKLTSTFHCPQKAGTQIYKTVTGEYTVQAADGYRSAWRELEPAGEGVTA